MNNVMLIKINGSSLKRWRTRRGISVEALAQSCGVPASTLKAIESNRFCNPSEVKRVVSQLRGQDPKEADNLVRSAADSSWADASSFFAIHPAPPAAVAPQAAVSPSVETVVQTGPTPDKKPAGDGSLLARLSESENVVVTFGAAVEDIKNWRKNSAVSQQNLAKASGLTQEAISRIERGSGVTTGLAAKIVEFFAKTHPGVYNSINSAAVISPRTRGGFRRRASQPQQPQPQQPQPQQPQPQTPSTDSSAPVKPSRVSDDVWKAVKRTVEEFKSRGVTQLNSSQLVGFALGSQAMNNVGYKAACVTAAKALGAVVTKDGRGSETVIRFDDKIESRPLFERPLYSRERIVTVHGGGHSAGTAAASSPVSRVQPGLQTAIQDTTPEVKVETPEVKVETPEVKVETPEVKVETSEVKVETSVTKEPAQTSAYEMELKKIKDLFNRSALPQFDDAYSGVLYVLGMLAAYRTGAPR